MKAFLLATGEENPLASIDRNIPSSMVRLVNRPVMVYALELLYRYGHKDIFVNLSYRSDTVEAYFENGQRWGVSLTYLLHREKLGTAGTLQRIQYQVDGTFLVLMGSSLIDFDIDAALAFHRTSGSIATAVLQRPHRVPTRASQFLQVDATGLVTSVDVVPEDTEDIYFNTGAYIFEPNVLAYIPEKGPYDCHFELLPALLAHGETVAGFITDGYWNPLDSFTAYRHAQNTLLKRLEARPEAKLSPAVPYSFIEGQQIADGIWRGKNTNIHPTARLHPPVCIGHGCEVGSDSDIGPNVVIGSHVAIDKSVSIKESTVFDSTYVGEGLEIHKKLIDKNSFIDIDTGDRTHVNDPLLLTNIAPSIIRNILRYGIEKLLTLSALILLLPLMLLISMAILVTSGAPIYTSIRKMGTKPGRTSHSSSVGPQSLSLLRFRTRMQNGDYTPLGKWLESQELYRLPELWSVFTGELGLVGVEPLCVEQIKLIQDEWLRQRYEWRAGFTGLWYTQATAESDFTERAVLDAYYTVNHSLWEDFAQLFYTPLAWLRGRRSEAGFKNPLYHSEDIEFSSEVGFTSKF